MHNMFFTSDSRKVISTVLVEHCNFQKGIYVCSRGTVATGMEALLIMLRRLAYPNRWSDLVPIFGRAQSELSAIFREVYIYTQCTVLKATVENVLFCYRL